MWKTCSFRGVRILLAKQTLRTSKITATELGAKERQLARALGRLKACRDILEELETDELYVFAEKSYAAGIESVKAFCFELEKSVDALDAGEPFDGKTTKAGLRDIASKKRKN